jgi:hypothetical protein
MLPKRRFWTAEQRVAYAFLNEFLISGSPKPVLTPLKRTSKTHTQRVVQSFKIFVWGAYNCVYFPSTFKCKIAYVEYSHASKVLWSDTPKERHVCGASSHVWPWAGWDSDGGTNDSESQKKSMCKCLQVDSCSCARTTTNRSTCLVASIWRRSYASSPSSRPRLRW